MNDIHYWEDRIKVQKALCMAQGSFMSADDTTMAKLIMGSGLFLQKLAEKYVGKY